MRVSAQLERDAAGRLLEVPRLVGEEDARKLDVEPAFRRVQIGAAEAGRTTATPLHVVHTEERKASAVAGA